MFFVIYNHALVAYIVVVLTEEALSYLYFFIRVCDVHLHYYRGSSVLILYYFCIND